MGEQSGKDRNRSTTADSSGFDEDYAHPNSTEQNLRNLGLS